MSKNNLQIKHWVGWLNNDSFSEGSKHWATLVKNEKREDNDLAVFRIPGTERNRLQIIQQIEFMLQHPTTITPNVESFSNKAE